jgi:hypothetical protein
VRRVLFLSWAILLPSLSAAGVPDPTRSTVPCLVACPAGDSPFVVTVRDVAGNPLANSEVSVEFCLDRPNTAVQSQPDFVFCCTGGACVGPGSSTSALTGPDGKAAVFVSGGGVLSSAHTLVQVKADGILLAYRGVTSVDLNADLVVDASDATIANGLVGLTDPSADFDCSGSVDAADLGVLAAHLGHVCHCPVPTRPTTWGRVKVVYR